MDTCYCVKRPGLCGEYGYCEICPIDPDEPKTITFTFEDVSPTETQIGGDHYAKNAIQPIDFILANNLGWCEANAVKYLTRWKDKNGLEDLRKAKHYIELLIERVEKENAA